MSKEEQKFTRELIETCIHNLLYFPMAIDENYSLVYELAEDYKNSNTDKCFRDFLDQEINNRLVFWIDVLSKMEE